jgi:2-C-methyl-D-erythritol 2,4-cyclodiphosphate synthase
MILLEKVRDIIAEAGYKVSNIDATIVAQKPKLASFIPQMNENIAKAMQCDLNQVNVKATTTEGLGFAGTQEGIASYAVVGIMKI